MIRSLRPGESRIRAADTKGRDNRHALSVFSEWIKRSLGCLLGSVSSLVGRCSSVSGLVSRSSSSVSSLVGSRSSSGISSSVGSRSSSVSSLRSSVGSRVSSGFSVSHCRVSGLGGSVFGLFRAGCDGQSSSGSSGSENDLAHVIAILEQRVEYARHQLRRTQSLPEGQTSRAQIIAIQTLCKHVRGLDNFHIIAAHPFVPAPWA